MGGLFALGFIVIIGMIIFSMMSYFRDKKFKEEVVQNVLVDIFEDVTYTTTKGIDRNRIFETKLVNRGNSYSSSDYLKAKYHDTEFEFANVSIEDHYEVNDTSHVDVHFNGQWLIIKPTQKIQSKLYVIDKNFRYSTPHKAGFFSKTDIEKIELESIGFNKEYRTYTNDAMDAFKILSPLKIMDLYEKHHLDVSFYLNEHELHIAIFSKKFIFGKKMFANETDSEQRLRVEKEIMSVLNYIEILD